MAKKPKKPASASAYHAKIRIPKMPAVRYAAVVGKAKLYKRSSVSMKEYQGALLVEIRAGDATALRASVNALMRDIQVIESAARIK